MRRRVRSMGIWTLLSKMKMWCLYSRCGHRSIHTLLQLNTDRRERRGVDVEWKKVNSETLWLVTHTQTGQFSRMAYTSAVSLPHQLQVCLCVYVRMASVVFVHLPRKCESFECCDGVRAFPSKRKMFECTALRENVDLVSSTRKTHRTNAKSYNTTHFTVSNELYAVTWSAHFKQRVCIMRSYGLLLSLHSTPEWKTIAKPFSENLLHTSYPCDSI